MDQSSEIDQFYQERGRKFSLKYWIWYAEYFIATYMCIKSAVYLVFQGYYIHLQTQSGTLVDDNYFGNESKFEDYQRTIFEYRHLLQQIGSVYRELSTFTMFAYATFFSILISFRFINLFTCNYATKLYRESDTILGYTNPSLANKHLHRQYDLQIEQLLISNMQVNEILSHLTFPSLNFRARTKLINCLGKQRIHLRGLYSDKSLIDSPNSTVRWKKEQTKLVLQLYYVIGMILYLAAMLAHFAAQQSCYQSLERTGQLPMSRLERLTFVEQLAGAMSTGDPFISAIIVLVANFREKNHELASIDVRLRALICSLMKIRLAEAQDGADRLKINKREYDKEAIELYLRLRVYMTRLEPTIRLSNMIMNQCVVFIVIVLTLTLAFYSDIDSSQVNIVGILTVSFICAINFALVMGAAFEASCRKVLELIWSLLANLSLKSSPCQHIIASKQAEFHADIIGELAIVESNILDPHTVFLWRQLVRDQNCISSSFTCTIFGSIELNYRNLLRMNFWFVSMVLIFLTHRG